VVISEKQGCNGGVLIGDLSQQSTFKQIIREERQVADQKELLLEESVDIEKLDAPPQVEQ
jgi:NAD(P)H-nitrite reductase large subunit